MREGPDAPGGRSDGPLWAVHGTLAVFLLTSLGLNLRLEVPLLPALLAAFLVVLLPVLSVVQLPHLASGPLDRPGVYVGSAVTLVVLTMAALVVGALGPGLGPMGFAPVPPGVLAAATGRLAAATAAVLAFFLVVAKVGRVRESPILVQLLPRNPHERRLFAGLALVAGFGEEVVFRGFLLAILTPALGDAWTALLVSSLAFGVLHVYQGPLGIVRTATLGGVLGASVIVVGSLWPAVVVHVAVDLVGGLVLGPRLMPLPGAAEGT